MTQVLGFLPFLHSYVLVYTGPHPATSTSVTPVESMRRESVPRKSLGVVPVSESLVAGFSERQCSNVTRVAELHNHLTPPDHRVFTGKTLATPSVCQVND